ncbi:MAG: DUF1425 domain-containing protein [Proteobacteria bacterium]|nr:DUF1425 domain-containing protein [Pseudomonadota bacterium]
MNTSPIHARAGTTRLICVMIAFVLVCACAGQHGTDIGKSAFPPPLFPCDVKHADLPMNVDVGNPVLDMDQSGLLQFELKIANDQGSSIVLQYQTIWYDGNRLSIPSVMSRWNRFVIPKHSSHLIFAIAPSPRAYRAEINILRAK